MFGDGNFIILMQGNVYASDICHPKGTSIRARCLVAVHPLALLCFSPLQLLEVAAIRATSYSCSVYSHRGALLGKTARECAVVVVSAVTRAHYLAGNIVPATKCVGMTTTLVHELEWPRHMCGTPSSQHPHCHNPPHLLFFNFL